MRSGLEHKRLKALSAEQVMAEWAAFERRPDGRRQCGLLPLPDGFSLDPKPFSAAQIAGLKELFSRLPPCNADKLARSRLRQPHPGGLSVCA